MEMALGILVLMHNPPGQNAFWRTATARVYCWISGFGRSTGCRIQSIKRSDDCRVYGGHGGYKKS